MNTVQYQEQATRTLALLDTRLMDDMHMILGMQTEVAELADVFKRHIAYGKEIDLINVKEELGDALWYIANMCTLHGWDLRDIMDINIAKLQSRYPEKFTQDKALNRDLIEERRVLAGGSVDAFKWVGNTSSAGSEAEFKNNSTSPDEEM